MTKLTNKLIERILKGAPKDYPSVITEVYGHSFDYCHDDDIHQLSDLREILSLRQELERLRNQKHYFKVTYMSENPMGIFLVEQDAIDFSNKFGGVYAIEQVDL